MIDFRSDNSCPPSPELLDALAPVLRHGHSPYATDEITQRVERRFCEIFDRDLRFFPLFSGTAANALALTLLAPRFAEVICHRDSHINLDECGAVEFQSGARLLPVGGTGGRITPDTLPPLHDSRDPHRMRPAVLSLSQCTELGTAYRATDIRALTGPARAAGLGVHMDGTRFANALATTGSTPADLSWRAGVDILCLGATKSGATGAEAVLIFNPDQAAGFDRLMKRAGHLASRLWFLSAQIDAWLENDLWLRLAAHSNAMASQLAGLMRAAGHSPLYPVEANMLFFAASAGQSEALSQAGFAHYLIARSDGQTAIRLVTSHATTGVDIERLAAVLPGILGHDDKALQTAAAV